MLAGFKTTQMAMSSITLAIATEDITLSTRLRARFFTDPSMRIGEQWSRKYAVSTWVIFYRLSKSFARTMADGKSVAYAFPSADVKLGMRVLGYRLRSHRLFSNAPSMSGRRARIVSANRSAIWVAT